MLHPCHRRWADDEHITTTIAEAVRSKETPMNEQHINLDDSVLAPKSPLGGGVNDAEGHIFLAINDADDVDEADEAEGHIWLQ